MKIENRKEVAEWIESENESSPITSFRVDRVIGRGKYQVLSSSKFISPQYASGYFMGMTDADFSKLESEEQAYRITLRGEKTVRVKHLIASLRTASFNEKIVDTFALYNVVILSDPDDPDFIPMTGAYTKSGDYIGDTDLAERLCNGLRLAPEMADPSHSVCTIGFCQKEDRWYGWSHRAIAGFGIGDKIYDEGFDDDKARPQDHGTVDVKNLDDAKLAATNYAACVS